MGNDLRERIKAAEEACAHPSWTCLYCGKEDEEAHVNHRRLVELERERDEAQASASALYRAIVKRTEPHFPADSRDLDWDVLPGTIGRMAAENARLSKVVEAARAVKADVLCNAYEDTTCVYERPNKVLWCEPCQMRERLISALTTLDQAPPKGEQP